MSGGGDEVEEGVHTVVAEAGVTLDPALLGQDVVVLALEVAHDLAEAADASQSSWLATAAVRLEHRASARELVVDLVTESRGVDDGERDPDALLLELYGHTRRVSFCDRSRTCNRRQNVATHRR